MNLNLKSITHPKTNDLLWLGAGVVVGWFVFHGGYHGFAKTSGGGGGGHTSGGSKQSGGHTSGGGHESGGGGHTSGHEAGRDTHGGRTEDRGRDRDIDIRGDRDIGRDWDRYPIYPGGVAGCPPGYEYDIYLQRCIPRHRVLIA